MKETSPLPPAAEVQQRAKRKSGGVPPYSEQGIPTEDNVRDRRKKLCNPLNFPRPPIPPPSQFLVPPPASTHHHHLHGLVGAIGASAALGLGLGPRLWYISKKAPFRPQKKIHCRRASIPSSQCGSGKLPVA
ncbi:hypothetical protein J5N97_013557 [Dioscorea zingiberensis]|uniref:Uncharacterized protein n=1 Tax=Dioscorea zingiberensis TaxID=325984 RepID=A0A9D5CTG8_9LILI|nr:hypothetical protein J5N97_013557 [Dioscorea zingiberensis]